MADILNVWFSNERDYGYNYSFSQTISKLTIHLKTGQFVQIATILLSYSQTIWKLDTKMFRFWMFDIQSPTVLK